MSETMQASPSQTVAEMVRALMEARTGLAEARDMIKVCRADFEARHAELFADECSRAAEVETLEREIKAVALAHYEATGETKPAPGVTVKLFDIVRYDPADALAWAKQAGIALVPEALDAKAFEKIAKATRLPFVDIGQVPRPQIATDLSTVREG